MRLCILFYKYISYPPNYVKQTLQMDFFNFAGIHRDVILYVKPMFFIQDVKLTTDYIADAKIGKNNIRIEKRV